MPPAPRRSRLRRAARALLGVLLLGVLLLAFAFSLLHTPQGAALVRVLVERWASTAIGAPLRIGRLDLQLWKGEASATAVSLRLPGTSLEVQRVEAAWWPGKGASVRALRPVVVVRDTGEPAREKPAATGLAAQPWRVLERLGAAAIVEGRVELRDARDAPWLVLGRVDAETDDAAAGRIDVRIADAAVGWPEGGLRMKPASLAGGLALDDGGLLLDDVRVVAGPSSLDLRGRLDRLSPITASAAVRVTLDGSTVAALAPAAEITGRISGEAAVEAVADRVTGTLAVSSPSLVVMGVGPWAASGRGRLEGHRLVLESLEARGYGGRLTAEGPLALLGTATTDARVRAEGIDVAALASALSETGVPVAARVDASLRWTTTGWDVGAARGAGELTLRPAARAGRAGPPGLPLAGESRLRVEGTAVALEGARVEAEGAWVEADLRFSAERTLEGAWRAGLPLATVAPLLADLGSEGGLPEGWAGTLVAEGEVAGAASSPEATARLRSEGLAVHDRPVALEAEARYAAGRLSLAPLALRSGQGHATLAGTVPVLAGSGEWDLEGDVDGLGLAPLLALAGLDGGGETGGTLRVAGPREAPVARAELDAAVVLAGGPGEEAKLSLAAESDGTRVRVSRFEADLAGGRVEGSGGWVRETHSVEVKARATGIAWSRLPLLPAPLRRVDGTLEADLSLAGTIEAPLGEARAALAGTTLDGSPLPAIALDARTDGRRLEIQGRVGESSVLTGTAALEGDWPSRFEIDAASLPAQAVLDAFPAARERRATVSTRGTLVVELPLRAPEGLRYSGDALQVEGRLRDLAWTTGPFGLEGDREALTLRGFRLSTPGTTATLDGRLALAPSAAFDLAIGLDGELGSFNPALPEEERVSGQAAARLRVEGTGEAPQVRGTLSLDGGRGRLEGALWRDLRLRARFLGDAAEVEELEGELLGGRVSARGLLPLRRLGGTKTATLSFEASEVDLARLLEAEGQDAAAASILVSLDGRLEATSPTLDGLGVRGHVGALVWRSPEGTQTLEAPAEWRLEGGRFALEPLRLKGPLGTLEARAEARLAGGGAEGSATISGPFDLRLLSPFVADTTLSGPASVEAKASWGEAGVRLDGGLRVEKARVVLESLAFGVTQLDGEVRFEGDRASLTASGTAGQGRLRASGTMSLGPAFLGPAELQLEVDRVPLAYPEGFRGRASGTVRLAGNPDDGYLVTGDVALAQAYYTAEFDAGTQSLERLDWQLAALRGGAIGEKLPLDVSVTLADPLRVRNSTVRLDVLGSLTASGTLAQPVVTGQVRLREGGTLTLSRAQVRVTEGAVELNGYPGGTPEVEFSGMTRVGGVAVSLQARGPLDDLELSLVSPDRPDLSQTDLVTLLLTGRTASAAASASGEIVAEELAATLGSALQKGVGQGLLIDVSPDRSLLADDTDPTQRFNVGHRLTDNTTVIYSTALDGTEKRWILDYNPGGGRFRLRLIDQEDESLSFEATDRISFELWSRARRAGRSREREVRRLTSLRFEGDLPVPEEELRPATKLHVGRRYTALRLEEAADRARTALARLGFPAAGVDAETTGSGSRSVDLVLEVDPGPRVSFVWSGDPLGGKVRHAAEAAWPPYASPDVAAAAVARAARVPLRAQRYYGAQVTPEVRSADGAVEVELRVSLGPRGTGVRVEFDGTTALDDRTLLARLPKPGSAQFFAELEGRATPLTNALRLAYARAGHVDARVHPPTSAVDAASGRLVVTFAVRERRLSRVAAVSLPDEIAAAGTAGPALELRVGDPFDVSAYVADRDAIGAWYRREGWLEARVAGFLEPGPEGIAVRYVAKAGPRPRVGEIRVVQDNNLKPRVVRSVMTLEPGELIHPRDLAETRELLSELGVFRSVEVRTEPRKDDPEVRDVEVNLLGRPDVTVEYGLRYSTSGSGGAGDAPSSPEGGRLQLAGAAELTNLLGWGWRARGYSFLTSKRQTWGVNLDAGTLFGRRLRTQVFLFDDSDDEIVVSSLASRVKGATFQQTKVLLRDLTGRRWHERLRLQWGYSFKNILYVENATRDGFLAGDRAFFSISLVGDQRDNLTDPHRGFFWTAITEASRRFLGSDVDYTRFYGQAFLYVPLLGERVVWAQGYRAGVVPGDDPLLLIENRFRAGGGTTVRGFEQNALGPLTAEGDSLGGQAVAVFNQELRFPIWGRVEGGVFWDAGNVWALASRFDLGDLRHTAGAGLRVMFPFGPLRAEYAWILDRQPGEPKGRFVFGLGHAF